MATAHKGVFVSGSEVEKARLEKDFQVILNGDVYHQTICTTTCILLVSQGKCSSCKSYRPQLRAMCSRCLSKIHEQLLSEYSSEEEKDEGAPGTCIPSRERSDGALGKDITMC